MKRNDILIADRLLTTEGGEMPVELPAGLSATLPQPGVHRGPLLTTDRVVRLPREKQSLFQRYGAMAVDMETFAVAEVCRRRDVPFSSVRVINDTADEALPRDVEHLLAQKTGGRAVGRGPGRDLAAAGQRERHVPVARKRPGRLRPIGQVLGGSRLRVRQRRGVGCAKRTIERLDECVSRTLPMLHALPPSPLPPSILLTLCGG